MKKRASRWIIGLLLLALCLSSAPAMAANQVRAVISRTSAIIDLAEGNQLRLTAYVLPRSASQSVVWGTSNKNIASVSGGLVTAKKVGRVKIAVRPRTRPGVYSVCTITIKDSNAPTSMTLSTKSLTLGVGETGTVTATLLPATANQAVTWVSSKPGVASVNDGAVTGKRIGTAVIRVRSVSNPALYKNFRVNVTTGGEAPSDLSIDPASDTLALGDTLQLTAIPYPSDASDSVEWQTNNSSVLTVSASGLVRAVGEGTAKIRARSTLNSAVYAIGTYTVTDSSAPTSVQIDQSDMYLNIGETETLTATVKPLEASQSVTWSSSDPSVATVSIAGKLTARTVGSTTITVKTATGGLKDSIIVTVLSGERTRTVPLKTTTLTGIGANLQRIDAVRQSAFDEIESLYSSGEISASNRAGRKAIVNAAFAMYRFPWMTTTRVTYWKGGSYYYPGTVYFGLPYTQTNRTYNTEKMLAQGYYSKNGTYYTTSRLANNTYPGNDCSSFASMANYGTNSSYSYLNSDAMYISPGYRTLASRDDLRPGDILVKHGHVEIFLYFTDSDRDEIMAIAQGGGAEPNTVACYLRPLSHYGSAYIARCKTSLAG